MSDGQKKLLSSLFRFHSSGCRCVLWVCKTLFTYIQTAEVRMMLSAFAAMEAVHQEAYSATETLGFGDDEYQKFFEHKAMLDKHEYLHDFGMDTPMDIAKTMAIYSGFTEEYNCLVALYF